jgi:hypothetical protein
VEGFCSERTKNYEVEVLSFCFGGSGRVVVVTVIMMRISNFFELWYVRVVRAKLSK